MINMKEVNGIPINEYALLPGSWDFYIEDPKRLRMSILRIVIKNKSLLTEVWNKLNLNNMVLVKIKHVR